MRQLTEIEARLLEVLLSHAKDFAVSADLLKNLKAQTMDDGGMGSILLFPDGIIESTRNFGAQLSEYEFIDEDGILVSVTLNADTSGRLFEIDVWKVDFSPVTKWPW